MVGDIVQDNFHSNCMDIPRTTRYDISESENPLLIDTVGGSVDFKCRPTVRSKSGGWKSAFFIIGVEMAERVTYYGISSNLITYLTGPLGMTTVTAAANVNAWSGTALLSPLLGAFIADSFWGRYKTIIIASLLYVLGLGFLTLSVVLYSFDSSYDKEDINNTTLQIFFFFFSLYVVALAQGGHMPCLQAFGADQFDEEHLKESKAKTSFFNWWIFSMCASVLPVVLILNYVQENISWVLGFGIPFIVMCIALILFVLGTATYRFRISSDPRNPFVRIGRVFVKACWRATPRVLTIDEEEASRILPREVDHLRFLDKALETEEHEKCCSIGDIEDAKTVLRLVPLWSTCLGYAMANCQAPTLFTKQGATMDRHMTSGFQLPAASLQSIIMISIFTFIPIYDLILVPIARAITKKPSGISMLQRIGIGLFLSSIAMVIAALVERKRISTAIEYGLMDFTNATIPMSVWWLVPQYIILGIAEAFTLVGLQEFFYDQVPRELKSVGIALCLSVGGIGNLLSSFLVSLIDNATSGNGEDGWFSDNLNRVHIDYFYWVLAGVNVVAFSAYVYFAKSYVYNTRKIV